MWRKLIACKAFNDKTHQNLEKVNESDAAENKMKWWMRIGNEGTETPYPGLINTHIRLMIEMMW